jgi:hypothetical protein
VVGGHAHTLLQVWTQLLRMRSLFTHHNIKYYDVDFPGACTATNLFRI